MNNLARQVFSETAERKPAFQSHASSRRNQPIEAFPDSGMLQRKLSCACGGGCPRCQSASNLNIGEPDDVYEREADAVADQVMAAPLNSEVKVSPSSIQILSRQASKRVATAPASVDRVLTNSGRPLEPALRQDMESRFGHDFSGVRLHTDNAATESARSLGARAYTLGNNVVFGAGEYQPDTLQGKRLLAHELTHTLQQGGARGSIQRSCGVEEIGTPAGCTSNPMEVAERPRYLFSVNCDDFLTGNELDLRRDAEAIQNGEEVELHGLSSEEGAEEFNMNLSCARALKAKSVVEDVLGARVITATLRIYSHGSQPGDRAVNRSVALVRRAASGPEPEPPPVQASPPAKDPYYDPVPGENVCSDSTFCTPYSSPAEIASARSYLLSYFIPVLEGLFGADVGALWRAYLARRPGDSLSPRIFDTPGNSIYEAFSTNNYIHDEVDNVLALIADRLSRGYGNVTQPLENFIDPPEKELSTDFANAFTIPGNIAGGIGSSDAGMDRRRITWGNVSFDITELPLGKRLVTIEAFVNFEVKDAIDFCPGQCGAILEKTLATIKMSRLEASGEAYDVPFIVRFPGPKKTKTVLT
jgi:hypothetical protein